MNKTRREYLKRINFVLDFIEKNLDADLSLEYLSKKAHYSPYHFHRVFLTVVGEKLDEFINRKRIERIASILLVEPNVILKDLAFRYGFNSDNSFSRAFKKYYGISPTKFKSQEKELLSKIGIEPFTTKKYIYSIDQINKWFKMNVKIMVVELEAIRLAGIMQIGGFENSKETYQRLMRWAKEKKQVNNSSFKALTIYHDNPNVTEISKVRHSACVTIIRDFEGEENIRPLCIKKGYYALGRFEINGAEIAQAWKSMCVWVLENRYEFRDGEYFEVYNNDHNADPQQKFIIDLFIPLAKTDNLKVDYTAYEYLSKTDKSIQPSTINTDYHQLIDYMKELRTFFRKEYELEFTLGKLNQVSPEYTYFSLTPTELKKLQLKFVIILDHNLSQFSICLSGQNKSIRKKYWQIFKGGDWNHYTMADSIENSLMIIHHTLIENPDYSDTQILTQQIEKESLNFMNDLRGILE